MSPRPYRLQKRQVTADETRARIVTAMRTVVLAAGDPGEISIDAVARAAGVSRTTVYQRFGSKSAVLDALFDDMAERGRVADISEAFREPDPLDALNRFVHTLGRFWTVERVMIRRMVALAALDAELGRAHAARNERRRRGTEELVRRVRGEASARKDGGAHEELANTLFALTSFETFDVLAGEERTPEDVVPVVQRLVRCVVLGGDRRPG